MINADGCASCRIASQPVARGLVPEVTIPQGTCNSERCSRMKLAPGIGTASPPYLTVLGYERNWQRNVELKWSAK